MNKKIIKIVIICFLIALGLEFTLFNIKHYKSLFYPKTIKYNVNKDINKNYYYNNNVRINVQEADVIEFTDIDKEVYNIYINGSSKEPSEVSIILKDEGNKKYYDAGSTVIVDDVKQTKYISLHPMGKLESIKLKIRSTSDAYIKSISLNAKVPFIISYIRIFIVFIISYIYAYLKMFKPFEKNYKEYFPFIVLCIGLLSVGIFFFVNFSNYGKDKYDFDHITHFYQYQVLARTLAKGKITLDLKVSDKLLALENPYDVSFRDERLMINEDYYLDYSFYNGKYYSYFGIVPCLFMYLPYYLITHHDLNNSIAVTFTCILYVIAGFFITYQLFNRFYPKSKFKHYLLCALSIAVLSGISMVIRKGFFYGIPIAFGSLLAMFGLGFWLRAARDEDKINTKDLALGSIALALVPGCRPQIFLSAFLGIPIFWKYLKNKELFKAKNVLALLTPMAICAGFLMTYNYVRYGSVIDFGVNYNLTSNDMTKRGFYFDRIPSGLFAFLFEAPHLNLVFPFIHQYTIDSNYIGITIYEEMIGGFALINMTSLINLFIFKFKKYIKNKEEFFLSLLAIIFSIIIIIADVQMAGILPRYMCDFGFMLSISAVILWMNIYDSFKNYRKLIFKILLCLVIVGLIYNFLAFFTDGFFAVQYNIYKRVYLTFYYLISFGV